MDKPGPDTQEWTAPGPWESLVPAHAERVVPGGAHGAQVAFEGVDVIRVDGEGRIQSLRAFWDPAPVLGKVMG